MRLAGCGALAQKPVTGTWYRAINARFWSSLLATHHTTTIPGRFNAGTTINPGFEILYFGEDHLVTLFEVQALLGSPHPPATYVPNPSGAWVVINVQVQLQSVADLTQVSQRKVVQTTVQELTGDWRGYLLRTPSPSLTAPYWTVVPTQRLGHELHGVSSLEGLITYSAKVPTKQNLVVFPKKLRRGSFLRVHNPETGATQSLNGPEP
ncbi:MAG: hypothetical protein NVSMB9_19480 [Isosphaeraceae bacterium]